MSMFRKKPIVVEAIRWTGLNLYEVETFLDPAFTPDRRYMLESRPGTADVTLFIKTPEGDMKASVGDYIVRGVKGEFYPCKPDIFELTNEPADTATVGGPPPWASEFDRPARREILAREIDENEWDVFETAGDRRLLARRLCFDEAMACTSAIICQHRLPYLKSVEQEREYIARYEKKPLSEKEA